MHPLYESLSFNSDQLLAHLVHCFEANPSHHVILEVLEILCVYVKGFCSVTQAAVQLRDYSSLQP